MRTAVYTLTRDRLEYTQHCFAELRAKAGCQFDHFIVDNGSTDGTRDWLEGYPSAGLIQNEKNLGISKASNQALDMIGSEYDLIIKMDNDCEVVYNNILDRIRRIYENKPQFRELFLSPRVEGIVNQPSRGGYTMVDDAKIGLTHIIGGLFHVMEGRLYSRFRYDESLPLAWGQDEQVCDWFRSEGGAVGYLEDIVVRHYETTDGQAKRYPEYFERKWKEEKQ